ncbi:MAG: hypothetical protein WC325_02760 [Candidatus Bathyarchaeia archaeon]|jgi:hypothetical protein
MSTQLPKVWSLIDAFKNRCCSIGWENCETEDWIKTEDGKYHNFLWMPTIHISTFEEIVSDSRCGIRKTNSYEVVKVSYMAWLLQEKPPRYLIGAIKENPELSEKTALYDLSRAYAGENVCRKLNETQSIVFQEFEQFLENEWQIELKKIDTMPQLTT